MHDFSHKPRIFRNYLHKNEKLGIDSGSILYYYNPIKQMEGK